MQFKEAVNGDSLSTHTSQKNPIGMEVQDVEGGVWKYMLGVASLAAGEAVTYDEDGVTARLAANAKGPVAFLDGAHADPPTATEYAWFQVVSGPSTTVLAAASSADNALAGRETADGSIGDGRAAGDQIYNFITRGASSAAGLISAQFRYPFVDDAYGS